MKKFTTKQFAKVNLFFIFFIVVFWLSSDSYGLEHAIGLWIALSFLMSLGALKK